MIKAHKLYICICLMWHKYTSGKFSSLPLSFSSTSRQGNKKKKKKAALYPRGNQLLLIENVKDKYKNKIYPI